MHWHPEQDLYSQNYVSVAAMQCTELGVLWWKT